MMLSHSVFDTPIVFEENKINVLVIENRNFLVQTVLEMKSQIDEGVEGEYILSDDAGKVGFKNTAIVTDVFSIDLNSRKNLTKLYAYLSDLAYNETNYGQTMTVLNSVQNFVAEIADASDYSLSAAEAGVQELMKVCDLKFVFDGEMSFLEKLCEYLSVSSEFLKIKLFVFLNLRQFVSDEDLGEIYKYIAYNKINVLLLESVCPEKRLDCEEFKIIDKDLCEIY